MAIERVAFTVFGKDIYWYGIVIMAAVLLGTLTAGLREKKTGVPRDTAIDFALTGLPAALICARLYYVAFEWSNYKDNLLSILDVRSGGMAIYGGIIGGALAAIWVAKRKRIPYGALADLIAPSLALGQAIGRWGNFFNQEAYGTLTTAPFWRFFPASVYIEALGEWHLAAFFYESLWCFGIWILLGALVRRGSFAGRRKGDVFFWYALLYSAERAIVEGLRTDSLYWGDVRVSQALSLLALAAIAVRFFLPAQSRRSVAWLICALIAVGWALLQAFGLVPGGTGVLIALCAVALAALFALYRQPRKTREAQ